MDNIENANKKTIQKKIEDGCVFYGWWAPGGFRAVPSFACKKPHRSPPNGIHDTSNATNNSYKRLKQWLEKNVASS